MLKQIFIARHHGFCMGVKRAINIAEETAATDTNDVTILNEIVHNAAVVERFKNEGVGQKLSVDDVEGGTLIISAHGVAPSVKERANAKGLKVIDATCPLVSRIYEIILKVVENGYHVIHIGDKNHDETIGVFGHAPEHITVVSNKKDIDALPAWPERKLGLTVQTTYHMAQFQEMEILAREKWPHIEVFDTICNATTKRQQAVMDLAPRVDMFLVVGSKTSANSQRLAEISNAICGNGRLINSAEDILDEWFDDDRGIRTVGVSAGASTPEFLVEAVVKRLVGISGGTAEVIVPERRKKIPRKEA